MNAAHRSRRVGDDDLFTCVALCTCTTSSTSLTPFLGKVRKVLHGTVVSVLEFPAFSFKRNRFVILDHAGCMLFSEYEAPLHGLDVTRAWNAARAFH
eukprot:4230622-Pleurochrysis_carterae.AAC.1